MSHNTLCGGIWPIKYPTGHSSAHQLLEVKLWLNILKITLSFFRMWLSCHFSIQPHLLLEVKLRLNLLKITLSFFRLWLSCHSLFNHILIENINCG